MDGRLDAVSMRSYSCVGIKCAGGQLIGIDPSIVQHASHSGILHPSTVGEIVRMRAS